MKAKVKSEKAKVRSKKAGCGVFAFWLLPSLPGLELLGCFE